MLDRTGHLEWARRTGGRLTPPETRRMLAAVGRGVATVVADRVRLELGHVLPAARHLTAEDLVPPDSALAREAEAACAEQPEVIAGHARRTWAFARAFSLVDHIPADPELLHLASLVHDFGLAAPAPGQDFTVRSAERALRCAARVELDPLDAERAADAICVHATPGITMADDGELGWYVQLGAMADLVGQGLWRLPRPLVDAVVAAHPRTGLVEGMERAIAAEAAAVPGGRFALLRRCGFGLAMRLAPAAG